MRSKKASKSVSKTTPKAAVKTAAATEVNGIVLKRAFPGQDADGLKLVRRHLRKTLRADGTFKFHKIGTRWVFPSKRDVEAARKAVAPYLQ